MQLNEKELLTSANKLQQTRISQKSSESMRFQESLVPQSGLRWSLNFYPSVRVLTLKVRLESEDLQAVLEKKKNPSLYHPFCHQSEKAAYYKLWLREGDKLPKVLTIFITASVVKISIPGKSIGEMDIHQCRDTVFYYLRTFCKILLKCFAAYHSTLHIQF